MGYIIAYSGTHGTGKTTAAYRTADEMKMANPDKAVIALCDLEAFCPYPINMDTSPEAQLRIFANQIRQELDTLARFDIVVTERTVVDVIAYTQAAGLDGLAMAMQGMAAEHIWRYQSITFRTIEFNNFWYADGIREHKDFQFRQQIEDLMIALYDDLIRSHTYTGEFHYA